MGSPPRGDWWWHEEVTIHNTVDVVELIEDLKSPLLDSRGNHLRRESAKQGFLGFWHIGSLTTRSARNETDSERDGP